MQLRLIVTVVFGKPLQAVPHLPSEYYSFISRLVKGSRNLSLLSDRFLKSLLET